MELLCVSLCGAFLGKLTLISEFMLCQCCGKLCIILLSFSTTVNNYVVCNPVTAVVVYCVLKCQAVTFGICEISEVHSSEEFILTLSR